MDAVEFIKTRNQICKKNDCSNCPIVEFDLCGYDEDVEKIVSIVENWKKEHPIKTRQSEFIKLFPNARMLKDGRCLDICPQNLENDINCPEHGDCAECACQYWLKEIE